MKTAQLDPMRVRYLLSYDPSSGLFSWNMRRGHVTAGSRAGNSRTDGYSYIKIDNVLFRTSRLAFLYMTGMWPKEHVDHINGITSDDRWRNLREVTRSQNQANRRLINKNGAVKGVFPLGSKFNVSISKEKVRYFLGTEKSKTKAIELYKAAAYLLFGEYAREASAPKKTSVLAKARSAIGRPKKAPRRPVRCLETGENFSSIKDAATAHGVLLQSIRASIIRGGTCAGYHFEFAKVA